MPLTSADRSDVDPIVVGLAGEAAVNPCLPLLRPGLDPEQTERAGSATRRPWSNVFCGNSQFTCTSPSSFATARSHRKPCVNVGLPDVHAAVESFVRHCEVGKRPEFEVAVDRYAPEIWIGGIERQVDGHVLEPGLCRVATSASSAF